MELSAFLPYLLVMSGVTYLIRAVPFVLVKRRIQNRFLFAFLYYVPYTVLAAMTFPAILYATNSIWSAAAGLAARACSGLSRQSAFDCGDRRVRRRIFSGSGYAAVLTIKQAV